MPHRRNLIFCSSVQEARKAGFRACKRCEPDTPIVSPIHAHTISDACRALEAQDSNLQNLAKSSGLSQFHFHRVFKAMTGLTPHSYSLQHRLQLVRQRLREGNKPIFDTIRESGFECSTSSFYKESQRGLGMCPVSYKDGGRDAEIKHAVIPSLLFGTITIATTDTGLCLIELAADARFVDNAFPNAKLTRLCAEDASFADLWAMVTKLEIMPSGRELDLPLDIQANAFVYRVADALRDSFKGAGGNSSPNSSAST